MKEDETQAEPTLDLEEVALRDFLREWKKLPVLVRAGVAGAHALDTKRKSLHLVDEAVQFHRIGLDRRTEVAKGFATAYHGISLLTAALAEAADAEAVALGIDMDTKGLFDVR